MALKGTLKDFGIADVLQLIGQQSKTGVLHVTSRQEEVEVSFLEGGVVRALSKARRSRELLGAMFVRGGLLTEAELVDALELQKRTLKRLGDILVAEGRLTPDQLCETTQLQTSETLYRLFGWKSGTYEFVQQDVELDPAAGPPLRCESVLLEGFRRIEQWPAVRRRIGSMSLTFERLRRLDPPPLRKDSDGDELDAALDAAPGSEGASAEPAPRSIGRNERVVYRLAEPGVSTERLCDLSRLGEFETCRALSLLCETGYLKSVAPKKGESQAEPRGLRPPDLGQVLRRGAMQTMIGLLLVLLFAVAAGALGRGPPTAVTWLPADTRAAKRVFAANQRARLMSGLELYRLAHGVYPERLGALAEEGILDEEELRYPYESPYHYRRDGERYVLLPPLN
jgi:hypothetical protein